MGKMAQHAVEKPFAVEDLGLIHPPSLTEAAGAQLTFPP